MTCSISTNVSHVQGMLFGARIGDALGLPAKDKTPDEILRRTNGVGITGFEDPSVWHADYQPDPTKDMGRGVTSDNWQLTEAVARALVSSRGYDQQNTARMLCWAYQQTTFGWGATNKASVEDLMAYITSGGLCGGRDDRRVPNSKPGMGMGNGVAIRVASLGAFDILCGRTGAFTVPSGLARVVMKHGFLTHPDPRASIAATCIAFVINGAFARLGSASGLATVWLDTMRLLCKRLERVYPHAGDPLSERFEKMSKEDLLRSAETLRLGIGTNGSVLESVPFAIGTFLRHQTSFRAGVLEAVNAGGDADSNASMVGAMIGANVGLDIPEEWLSFRPEYASCYDLGEGLVLAADMARIARHTQKV